MAGMTQADIVLPDHLSTLSHYEMDEYDSFPASERLAIIL